MTTFDPAHKHPTKIILSNGNLTASAAPGILGDGGVNVRSTTGKSGSERGHAEFRLDAITQISDGEDGLVDGNVIVGIVNETFVPGVGNLHGSAGAVGYENNGTISVDGIAIATGPHYGLEDVVYIDLYTDVFSGIRSIVFGVVGGASRVIVDGSSLGAGLWYAAVQMFYQDDVWTGNFHDPFVRTPAWDPPRGRAARFVLGM